MDGSIPSIRIQATKHNGKSATTRLGEQCLQYAVTPLAWAGAGQSIDVALKYTAPLPRMGSGPAARRGCCFFECYTFWAFQDCPLRKKKRNYPFNIYVTPLFFFCLHSSLMLKPNIPLAGPWMACRGKLNYTRNQTHTPMASCDSH